VSSFSSNQLLMGSIARHLCNETSLALWLELSRYSASMRGCRHLLLDNRGECEALGFVAELLGVPSAEASGSEGEEGSGDMSDDDFFMKGDISDVDADDEWTDISPR
jgi:hypothetical protein